MPGSYKDELKKEADELYTMHALTKAYRKRKLIAWGLRTILTIVIYIICWEYEWIRWTLIAYIPLSLFNLLVLLGWNPLLKRKLRQIKERVDNAGQ